MNTIQHSAKGTTWKKGHKYLYKKNGKYYYAKPGKSNNNYNWFEDWYGEDEFSSYKLAEARKGWAKEDADKYKKQYEIIKKHPNNNKVQYYSQEGNKRKAVSNTSRAKDLMVENNKAYMKAVRNYNEKKAAYEKTPKAKVRKFIDKGKNFFKSIIKNEVKVTNNGKPIAKTTKKSKTKKGFLSNIIRNETKVTNVGKATATNPTAKLIIDGTKIKNR